VYRHVKTSETPTLQVCGLTSLYNPFELCALKNERFRAAIVKLDRVCSSVGRIQPRFRPRSEHCPIVTRNMDVVVQLLLTIAQIWDRQKLCWIQAEAERLEKTLQEADSVYYHKIRIGWESGTDQITSSCGWIAISRLEVSN
jgi:hypothetical protein